MGIIFYLQFMNMTIKEAKEFEDKLDLWEYKKITSCRYNSNDSFEWYQTYRNASGEILYQIFFEFWDFTKFELSGNNAMGVSITILPESDENGRRDLTLSVDWVTDIARVERVAANFYKFVKEQID